MGPAQNGWHWPEWLAEALGTAILLFAVVTAKDFAVRAGASTSVRIVIVAAVGGLVVILVAYSPLGRRSGAHLNPAVTLGFWVQRIASTADLVGYSVAQTVGGILGALVAVIWGPTVPALPVEWAVIEPAVGASSAVLIETLATMAQLVIVFALLGSPRLRPWTPAVAAVLLVVAVVALAELSGAGFNPVRGLAPDVLAGRYPGLWVFLVGPLVGAALAAAALRPARCRPLTGKLNHDADLPCHMACALPHAVDRRSYRFEQTAR